MCNDELMTRLGEYPGNADIRLTDDGWLEIVSEEGEHLDSIDMSIR